jgi:hypothetical protein
MPCPLPKMSAGRTRAAAHPGPAAMRIASSRAQHGQQHQQRANISIPPPAGPAQPIARPGRRRPEPADLGARPRSATRLATRSVRRW